MKSAKELLRAKRDGAVWSNGEIEWFVHGLVEGTVSHPQAAAFLMAACIHGLRPSEVAALTSAMAESGEHLAPNTSQRPRIDKHSSGGVGDKVSLLLTPIAACCGLSVPMISGRGLGHTGGTVDKLESVPGMNMIFTIPELEHHLHQHHSFMAAQSLTLAPADRLLYALRDVTGTVENTGLLTASILSKKFAERLDGLVIDLKVGKSAFMETQPQAEEFATVMCDVARISHLPFHVLFTRMDNPLGYAVGNWVEVVEAEEALGNPQACAPDLYEVTLELAANMVQLGFCGVSMTEAVERVTHVWKSGLAHREFMLMLSRQGGDYAAGQKRQTSVRTSEVKAQSDGFIHAIQGRALSLAIMQAGGGRMKETDRIDPVVGVRFTKRIGSEIRKGETIAVISATNEQQETILCDGVLHSVTVTKTAPEEPEPSMIIQRWTS